MSGKVSVFLENGTDEDFEEKIFGKNYYLPAGCKRGPVSRHLWAEDKERAQENAIPIGDSTAVMFARRHPKRVRVLWDQATLASSNGKWVFHEHPEGEASVMYGGKKDTFQAYKRICLSPEVANHWVKRHGYIGYGQEKEQFVFFAPIPSDAWEANGDMPRSDLQTLAKTFGLKPHSTAKAVDVANVINAHLWKNRLEFTAEEVAERIRKAREGKEA